MEKTYYKHKLENFLIIQKIVIVHYLEADKRFSFPEEAHNFWELVYADKESVVCSADGQEIVLEEGEILFHKPNERHSLRANGKTAPNIFIVSFECKNEAMRFFENKRLRLNKRLLRFVYRIIEESKKTFDLPYSDPALKKMKLRKKPPIGGQQLIKNYLEILLIDLMRDETEKEDSEIVFLQKNERDGYVSKRVVSYLREHIRENVGVADICKALNYNKSYLFQQFTADIGMPIMTYFTKLKMELAKKLLRESDAPVAQIADELAFESAGYFSKCFKKHVQKTPLQYRKFYKQL